MKLSLYTIKFKARKYGVPFVAADDDDAMTAWLDWMNRESLDATKFRLIRCGRFDSTTGRVQSIQPVTLSIPRTKEVTNV